MNATAQAINRHAEEALIRSYQRSPLGKGRHLTPGTARFVRNPDGDPIHPAHVMDEQLRSDSWMRAFKVDGPPMSYGYLSADIYRIEDGEYNPWRVDVYKGGRRFPSADLMRLEGINDEQLEDDFGADDITLTWDEIPHWIQYRIWDQLRRA